MNIQASIFQINASAGGVPKLPLRLADVNELGITVDQQEDKRHHGGPERALCLYSLERIVALQGEGHPIYPGSIGENVTIAGLDWDNVQPGVQLQLGQEVLVEITSYASPCKTIRHSFVNENFSRAGQKQQPGWARAYARILHPGQIRIGDDVTLANDTQANS